MQIKNKVIIVTGGASGIGKALCERFAAEGAKAIVVADIDKVGVDLLVQSISGKTKALGIITNVAIESEIQDLIERTIATFGSIHLFCSNAGILTMGGEEVPTEDWQKIWDINLMAHVFASRAVLPSMIKRGKGYFLITASAAGLLSQIGSAPYSVTKHAAIGFAEWLSITHGDKGITVSALCPQAVHSKMTEAGVGSAGLDGVLEAEVLAQNVVEGLAAENFLILPHPEVLGYIQNKSQDYDRWIRAMRRLQEKFDM